MDRCVNDKSYSRSAPEKERNEQTEKREREGRRSFGNQLSLRRRPRLQARLGSRTRNSKLMDKLTDKSAAVPGRNQLKLAGSFRIDRISSMSEIHRRRSPDDGVGIFMFRRLIPPSRIMAGDRLAESRRQTDRDPRSHA
jgi:hypothetical protein